MRRTSALFVSCVLLFTGAGVALSGGDNGRAIVDKAVKAAGGQAKLAQFQSSTWKATGTYYGMGDGLPYTASYAIQRPNKFRMEIEGVFTTVLNGDKGWVVAGGNTQEMKKDQIAVEQLNNKASSITGLAALKDKAFQIKSLGNAKVGGQPANVVEVTRKGYPTVKLYFSTKSSLLVKSEFRTKAPEMEFKEVMMESLYSDYRDVNGAKLPHKMVMNRDGKKYVEAEASEYKSAPKLDPKTFDRPGE